MSAEEQAAAQQAAEAAALAWFALLDAGKYTESWGTASPFFRQHRLGWRDQIDRGRYMMGPLHWRKLQSAVFAQTIPWNTPEGGPFRGAKGEYVILKFSSYYRFKMTETVTVMKDPDGIWRVADYYIAYGDAAPCTGSKICG